MKTLPCKHQKMLPCNIDKDLYQCNELVLPLQTPKGITLLSYHGIV